MALKEEELKQVKHRKPRKLPKVLTQRQVEALFATFNVKCPTGLRNRVVCEVLYRCGLRISEVCNLTPADVDLQEGYIYVQQGKNKKDRYVPLDPETITWLKRWEAIRPKESDWYFCNIRKEYYGNKLSPVNIRQVLKRKSEQSGVFIQDGQAKTSVTPHKFRHTYATELMEEGFSLPEVQALLGHSSIQTTSIYTHVRPEKLATKIRQRGKA
jgi:site-specific recombinase XerD